MTAGRTNPVRRPNQNAPRHRRITSHVTIHAVRPRQHTSDQHAPQNAAPPSATPNKSTSRRRATAPTATPPTPVPSSPSPPYRPRCPVAILATDIQDVSTSSRRIRMVLLMSDRRPGRRRKVGGCGVVLVMQGHKVKGGHGFFLWLAVERWKWIFPCLLLLLLLCRGGETAWGGSGDSLQQEHTFPVASRKEEQTERQRERERPAWCTPNPSRGIIIIM